MRVLACERGVSDTSGKCHGVKNVCEHFISVTGMLRVFLLFQIDWWVGVIDLAWLV